MNHYRIFVWAFMALGFAWNWPLSCEAQTQVLSTSPPNVEYQYQIYYPRWFGWPGPGLSLGGSLPSRGREGYSSFYGRPLPVPLGSGVYVNSYAYATQLPGFASFGLAQNGPSPNGNSAGASQPVAQSGGPGMYSALPPAPPTEGTAEKTDAGQARPVTSNDASMRRSREMQSFGDDNLRHQQWNQAYINYRNAVEIANDNADAHFRLGLACIALKKYSEAVREFKQALTSDPALVTSQESLATVLGPDSEAVRTDLTRNVARWTREDLRDQDRLFLLGAILRFNDDRRSQEILEAAFRMTGSGDHLVALLAPQNHERGIQLTARLRECEQPDGAVPFSEEIQGTTGHPSLRTVPKSNQTLPPAPPPEPPEAPKLPQLHQRPINVENAR